MSKDTLIDIVINRKMLKHFSPVRNFIYGILFLVFVFLIAPITIDAEYEFATFFYIIACGVSFCLGAFLYSGIKEPEKKFQYSLEQVRYQFSVLAVIAMIGVLAKFYDTFFIRRISFSLNMLDNRAVSEDGSANPIAIIAAVFMHAPYVLIVYLYCFKNYCSKFMRIIAWGMFGCQFLYPILLGSRSGLLFPVVFIIMLMSYIGKIKIRLCFKTVIFFVLVLVVGCILSGKMYSERGYLINSSLNVVTMTRGEGASLTVPANDTAYKLIMDLEDMPVLQNLVLGYVNICQYYTHGVFECHMQKKHVDSSEKYSNGGYMFFIYTKFFRKIFNSDQGDPLTDYFLRPGIFCSVWGTLYTDFGWLGVVVMFFWGYIQKLIWRVVWNTGNPVLLPWVFLGGMVIFLFPLLNLFAGTLSYAFTLMIICYFLFPYRTPQSAKMGQATSQ